MTEELSVPPILAKLAMDARPSVVLARRRVERLATLLGQPLLWIGVIALAARFYQISYHSLWFDEAVSVHWARQPAVEIWRVGTALLQDKHPPLYYLTLHYWRLIFGDGDLALRSLGAIWGAVAVLPVYGIGRRLSGRAGGLAAAALVAINPFLVWYSQEVRMFMPAATLLLCGLYGILAFFDEDASPAQRSLRWLLAALALAAACYTYLFSALVLPVAALWAMLLGARAREHGRRLAVLGLLAIAAAGLLFLPLFLNAWAVSGAEYQPGEPFAGMAGILWTLLKSYTFGRLVWPEPLQTIAGILAGGLALAGLIIPVTGETGRSRMGGVLLFCLLAIPLFAGGWMLARNRATFAETRLLPVFGARPLPGVGQACGRSGLPHPILALRLRRRRIGAGPAGSRRLPAARGTDAGSAAGQLGRGKPARGLARDRLLGSRRWPAHRMQSCFMSTTSGRHSSTTAGDRKGSSSHSPIRSGTRRR